MPAPTKAPMRWIQEHMQAYPPTVVAVESFLDVGMEGGRQVG